jgi:hemolysin activation/secretion protein
MVECLLEGMSSTVHPSVKAALTLAVLLLAPSSVHGQVLDPTSAEELRQIQRREDEARDRQQKAFDLPTETPCFELKEILLEGDAGDHFSWVGRALRGYTGRCAGREGLDLIVKRVTAQILERGFTSTRVAIPEQDLSGGTLRLVVTPGLVRSIRFADEGTRGFWQTAFPVRAGDLLDMRDIDQGLEQWKRVPSQDAKIEVRPAESPGESDIVIEVKRKKPWRAGLSLDNSGARSTGKLQAAGAFSLDNPSGLNDLLSLTVNHDLDARQDVRGTWGGSAVYSVPYGYWTATLSASHSGYHQVVAKETGSLSYSGTGSTLDLNVQRVIHRNRVSKTALQVGMYKRWAKAYAEDVGTGVQRINLTAASLGASHRRFFGRAVLDAAVDYRQGVPWLAQDDPASGDDDAATTRYRIWTIDVNVTVPFQLGIPLRYSNHSRAQVTGRRLIVCEQFAIGGRLTVRGFDEEQSLAGERGWYTRNEIGMPILQTGQELYVGVDHGEVYGPSARALVGQRITGSAVGVRGRYRALSYDLFAGWPLSKPEGFRTAPTAFGFMLAVQL